MTVQAEITKIVEARKVIEAMRAELKRPSPCPAKMQGLVMKLESLLTEGSK